MYFFFLFAESMGDTEFVAAFYHLLIPIARQFEPDMASYRNLACECILF